jgi:mRNA interferase MazF
MEAPERKPRPALIVQRDAAINVMGRVAVAPLTTTRRNLPTCLALGADEGLDRECVANFDSIAVVPKYALTQRLGDIGARRHELFAALMALADC